MSKLIKLIEKENLKRDDIQQTFAFAFAIGKIKKQQLNDRFFLEEAIFRNIKCWDNAEEYTDTLLHDWLSEMVTDNPLTEEERKKYIAKELGWDDDFIESAYFSSEKQLAHYLKTKQLLSEEEIDEQNQDYSITDNSTPNEI